MDLSQLAYEPFFGPKRQVTQQFKGVKCKLVQGVARSCRGAGGRRRSRFGKDKKQKVEGAKCHGNWGEKGRRSILPPPLSLSAPQQAGRHTRVTTYNANHASSSRVKNSGDTNVMTRPRRGEARARDRTRTDADAARAEA